MSALDRVQLSDLDEEQQQVAELIGLDNYKRLVTVFGGLSIYIQSGRLGADGPRRTDPRGVRRVQLQGAGWKVRIDRSADQEYCIR